MKKFVSEDFFPPGARQYTLLGKSFTYDESEPCIRTKANFSIEEWPGLGRYKEASRLHGWGLCFLH